MNRHNLKRAVELSRQLDECQRNLIGFRAAKSTQYEVELVVKTTTHTQAERAFYTGTEFGDKLIDLCIAASENELKQIEDEVALL